MSAKILKAFLMVSVALITTACCDPKIEYVDRPVEVKIPVKCRVPDTYCDFNRTTDTEVMASMLECIIELRKASEICK